MIPRRLDDTIDQDIVNSRALDIERRCSANIQGGGHVVRFHPVFRPGMVWDGRAAGLQG